MFSALVYLSATVVAIWGLVTLIALIKNFKDLRNL